MCGIIGIVSKDKHVIAPSLIGALSRLEYRGYDSAGISVVHDNGLLLLKCVGAPSQHLHESDLHQKEVLSTVGIGHNRWATHGKPTLLNAHPHIDSSKRFSVVHNGTILNYESLRKELSSSGISFLSDTDTEVIPHLISFYNKCGISTKEAFIKTIERLEGAFGIVMMDKEDPHTLYVAKQGSPIVIGVSDGAYYVASSVHGFLPHTNRYITLMDGEVAILNTSPDLKMDITNIKHKSSVSNRKQETAEVEAHDISKGDFETFMLKEIHEQPATTLATLLGRIDVAQGTSVLGGLIDYEGILENSEYMLITGCGTAYHAGEVGAYVLEKLSRVHVRTEIASEGRYKSLHLPKEKTTVFAISQSGETADTLEYIKELKRKQYETFGVVNVVGSALALLTGKGVYTKAGSEIGVASSKAFTSQLAAMYLLALYIARMKDMPTEDGVAFATLLESIPNLIKETLLCEKDVEKIAKHYASFTKVQFLGRGIHVPIAKEASLKFKELTYLETGSYPLGELKHGPIAIIDDETLSVVILPKDELFSLGVNSIEQIQSKGGKVLLITDASSLAHPICEKVDHVIFIPTLSNPLLYPFLEIIPLQIFAYYFAKELGRNIDKPRNLAKSVTVQ